MGSPMARPARRHTSPGRLLSRATSSISSAAVPGALPVFHVAVVPAEHVARFIGPDAEGGAALRVLVDHRARAVDLAVSLAELVPIGAAAVGFAERSATAEEEHEAQGCAHAHNVRLSGAFRARHEHQTLEKM